MLEYDKEEFMTYCLNKSSYHPLLPVTTFWHEMIDKLSCRAPEL